MDFTMELCKSYNLSPFDVLNQEKDEVIMMINYFIEKSDYVEETEIETELDTRTRTATQNNGRIRVNDKTATGGWF